MTEQDMEHYRFENTPLPYAYDALEPYIDALTMELHHDRHLQTYIDNLNAALSSQPRLQSMPLEQLILISGRLPKDVGVPIWRNAGGVYNHRFFFDGMNPDGALAPVGELSGAIAGTFGSFDNFKKEFADAAMSVFGSGYAWLVMDRRGRISVITTANQDTPLPLGYCPIVNIDVWEHAYYLKHYNRRADYIDDWFSVADWQKANDRYLACQRRLWI